MKDSANILAFINVLKICKSFRLRGNERLIIQFKNWSLRAWNSRIWAWYFYLTNCEITFLYFVLWFPSDTKYPCWKKNREARVKEKYEGINGRFYLKTNQIKDNAILKSRKKYENAVLFQFWMAYFVLLRFFKIKIN